MSVQAGVLMKLLFSFAECLFLCLSLCVHYCPRCPHLAMCALYNPIELSVGGSGEAVVGVRGRVGAKNGQKARAVEDGDLGKQSLTIILFSMVSMPCRRCHTLFAFSLWFV